MAQAASKQQQQKERHEKKLRINNLSVLCMKLNGWHQQPQKQQQRQHKFGKQKKKELASSDGNFFFSLLLFVGMICTQAIIDIELLGFSGSTRID